MLKVFQMNDSEWWVGESAEACIAAMRHEYGEATLEEVMEGYEPHELDEAAMNKLKYHESDDEGSHQVTRTFAQQLERDIAEGGRFPRCFASTEY